MSTCEGRVWDRAPSSPMHALLQSNVGFLLASALKGRPCVAYGSDLRVRVDATDRSTYPDASVVCGPCEMSARDEDAITNPSVLVEVFSAATETDDRGEKFAHYRHLPSLKAYVLISQDRRSVEVFERTEGGAWSFLAYTEGSVPLGALGVSLSLDEVYEDPSAVT